MTDHSKSSIDWKSIGSLFFKKRVLVTIAAVGLSSLIYNVFKEDPVEVEKEQQHQATEKRINELESALTDNTTNKRQYYFLRSAHKVEVTTYNIRYEFNFDAKMVAIEYGTNESTDNRIKELFNFSQLDNQDLLQDTKQAMCAHVSDQEAEEKIKEEYDRFNLTEYGQENRDRVFSYRAAFKKEYCTP